LLVTHTHTRPAHTMNERLSLCLIVKDEADMLPDFLASVSGLWDELIAVDTGSCDARRASR